MPFEASANEIKSNVDLLVAKHMPLFIVALMFVTMFAVLGMWTTFWPLLWCASSKVSSPAEKPSEPDGGNATAGVPVRWILVQILRKLHPQHILRRILNKLLHKLSRRPLARGEVRPLKEGPQTSARWMRSHRSI